MTEAEVRARFAQLGFDVVAVWEEFAVWIFHQTVGFDRATSTKYYYRHDVERFVMRIQERTKRR